jgi:hypothetical protein
MASCSDNNELVWTQEARVFVVVDTFRLKVYAKVNFTNSLETPAPSTFE